MKNIRILSWIALTMAMVLVSQHSHAQELDRKTQRKLERVKKREARRAALEDNKARILDLVRQQTFVIEANSLFDKYQNRYEVSPDINFIKIEGDQGIIQFGFNHLVGYNGLGGLTINGFISGYTVNSGEPSDPITITANVSSPNLVGPATLSLSILSDGSSRATINGAFGARLTFSGDVSDLENSRVYQGMTIL